MHIRQGILLLEGDSENMGEIIENNTRDSTLSFDNKHSIIIEVQQVLL